MWLNWFNVSVPIYVGKAMRDQAPRDYGDTPMEIGIYANVCETQAGKRTLLGILIGLVGWFQVSSFKKFFKVVQTHGYKKKK